jgi:hypothetical protein
LNDQKGGFSPTFLFPKGKSHLRFLEAQIPDYPELNYFDGSVKIQLRKMKCNRSSSSSKARLQAGLHLLGK